VIQEKRLLMSIINDIRIFPNINQFPG